MERIQNGRWVWRPTTLGLGKIQDGRRVRRPTTMGQEGLRVLVRRWGGGKCPHVYVSPGHSEVVESQFVSPEKLCSGRKAFHFKYT